MLRELEVTAEEFECLSAVCEREDIEFLVTPFDVEMAEQLVSFGMKKIKVASGEITNVPALRKFASFNLPIILSSGMSTLEEVGDAIDILTGAELTLLHCTSLYPAPVETLNLRAMQSMASAFGLPVGYSDHSLGDYATIAAVALGATVIEKHFTLDRSLPARSQSVARTRRINGNGRADPGDRVRAW